MKHKQSPVCISNKEKAKLAQQILQKLHQQNDQDGDSDTDDETLEPPTAPLTKSHFNRRRSANIALAAAEESTLRCYTHVQNVTSLFLGGSAPQTAQ